MIASFMFTMASEKLKITKSDPSELGMDTIDVVDGIVIDKNSEGNQNVTEVKLEPEFLCKEEENSGGNILDLDNVDPFGLEDEDEEEEIELNRRPTRLKTPRKNFGIDFACMSDDSDCGWEDSSDEYQLDESSDVEDYRIESQVKGKRVLGGRQSSVAKKQKTTADNTMHTPGWFNSKHFLFYINCVLRFRLSNSYGDFSVEFYLYPCYSSV